MKRAREAAASGATAPPLPRGPLDGVRAETIANIRRSFLIFRGEFSPRELFVYQEPQMIDAEVERLVTEGETLVGGALRNRAIKRLWTEDKKVEYADKVDPDAGDITA
jgi:hypothetical protein